MQGIIKLLGFERGKPVDDLAGVRAADVQGVAEVAQHALVRAVVEAPRYHHPNTTPSSSISSFDWPLRLRPASPISEDDAELLPEFGMACLQVPETLHQVLRPRHRTCLISLLQATIAR